MPDISMTSAFCASSLLFNVDDIDSGVMPDVFATSAAWESVSAAIERSVRACNPRERMEG